MKWPRCVSETAGRKAASLFLLVVTCLMLFLFLERKPLQHDEGVNAVFIEDIAANGYYAYDPANYHGPLHHYLMFFFHVVLGDHIWVMRLSAVLFTLAAVFLTLMFTPFIGWQSAWLAALFTAVSPGMIFYSRYGIHESGLYFFLLLGWYGFFHYRYYRNRASLWILGAAAAGMIAMKETYVLALGCFVLSYGLLFAYEKIQPSTEPLGPGGVRRAFGFKDLFAAAAFYLFVIVVLYSGFFMYWKGVGGLFQSIADWFTTGASQHSEQKGHWKSALYWVQLFLKYEWVACAGLLFVFPSLGPVPAWRRLMAFFAVSTFLVYSAIPYKTPWCIMQLIWPFLFVAAGGFAEYAGRGRSGKVLIYGVVALLAGASLCRTVELNFRRYADEAEPYAHVQTFGPVMELMNEIETMARGRPAIRHADIHVMMKSYWPINWHLRNFSNTGYYTEHYPMDMDAGMIFCDTARKDYVEMRLSHEYLVKRFRLNPAQEETFVYFDKGLFEALLRPPYDVFRQTRPEPDYSGKTIRAVYYANASWQGSPVREEQVGGINFGWEEDEDKPLRAPFSAVYEGEIFIPVPGDVTFYLASDDGAAFYLGEDLVVDHPGEHPEKVKSALRPLSAGWHPFRIKYFDAGGQASLRLWWKLPSGRQDWIPPQDFRAKGAKT